MKLLLDEMLDASIADELRKRGRDVDAIQGNAELEGKRDADLLRRATDLDRVVVTDNVQDFARLHQRFLAAGTDHAGILLVSPKRLPRSKRTIGLWVEALDVYLRDNRQTSMKNLCDWL